jgi:hypothetical protein
MLALKGSMLGNENKIVTETALTATASATHCPFDDCTGGDHTGASGGGHGSGSGSGYCGHSGWNNRGRGRSHSTGRGDRGNNANASSSRYPTPHGPWICFNPYTQGAPMWRGAPLHDLRSPADAICNPLNNMTPPSQASWVVDFGTTSHMSSDNGIIPPLLPLPYPVYVTVGNGAQVPVRFYSNMHLCLPSSNFVVKRFLCLPSLIQNLISVRQFTHDNVVSIEFDPFVFPVKDLWAGHVIIRCNSSSDLYTIPPIPTASSTQALISCVAPTVVWHTRLGLPGNAVLNKLHNSSSISYNKTNQLMCHA